MSIRFSYSPADSTLTLQVRDQPTEIIERALDRAAETGALEIRVHDGSSAARWPVVAELCMQRGARFVYRRVAPTGRRSAGSTAA